MSKHATIYRMVTEDHLCPWGIKAKDLLNRNGYEVEDRHLETMEENETYKKENGFDETPQIFVDGERLGTYDDLREELGKGPDPKEGKTYQPVIAVFGVAAAMAVTTTWASLGELSLIRVAELFIAFSMCVLGILKLQDLKSYATGFVQYDLVARHYVPYAYVYAFIEAAGGALMIASIATLVVAPIVLIASSIGAVSIINAVYVKKRDLNCACVGGGSSVPLGFISLSENLLMMAMAIWMLAKTL
ncbi:glutaredoxin [Pelagicoccus sp. SDUM812003]|uniref:glutaredoxin n=1 Tax=Pelagicoccus sp. SDUM812003 TaxID=3041267 RepID=UPI00280EF295|nr:glutaredoxin [Pelagicoccus sp. SDUM812003]MDQ8205040.1 glutaredoxin [Pelagicoccus sp. SDUM812003]